MTAQPKPPTFKCDFCDKPAIGYVSMQAAIYCGEHQTEAELIEKAMLAEIEKSNRSDYEQ